jgi:hypothetical protein
MLVQESPSFGAMTFEQMWRKLNFKIVFYYANIDCGKILHVNHVFSKTSYLGKKFQKNHIGMFVLRAAHTVPCYINKAEILVL